jgi:hypothetical protein
MSVILHPLELSCGAAAPPQRTRSQTKSNAPTYILHHQHFLPSSQLVPTDDEMKHELIESWTEKLVQQPRPKRPLDNGFVPGPARPRQHYPTPEGDCLEQKELEQTKG